MKGKMKVGDEVITVVIPLLFVILIALSIVWVKSYNEARIFNKFSDQKITTWDAVWGDFRILPKEGK